MFAGLQFLRSAATAGAAIAVSTMLVAGCGTAGSAANPGGQAASSVPPKVIVVHDNANGRTVSMRTGDSLELILSSSYWKVAGSSASRVLRQVGGTVLMPRPSSCPSIPGLGCIPLRTDFKALTSGKAVIRASRLTCGEALACQPPARLFTLTVVVSS